MWLILNVRADEAYELGRIPVVIFANFKAVRSPRRKQPGGYDKARL